MKKIWLITGATILFLQGCTYAISPDLAKNAVNLPFDELENEPELYAGKLVILGGSISLAGNSADGTLIEVSQKPLDYWGKPLQGKEQGGLFLVLYTAYLDVQVYGRGRNITVAGVVAGTRRKGLSTDYALPVIISKELKLWPSERRSWKRPPHLDPLYDPYSSPRQY
jgi:outer membrane lipoprotein